MTTRGNRPQAIHLLDQASTYGRGGYFSPQYYLLPAIPLTYAAQQSTASYFPLDPALQASRGPICPAEFSLGLSYGVQRTISYLRGRHWLLTAFLSANNAASYNQHIGGVSVHYLFPDQHIATRHAAGWFPTPASAPIRFRYPAWEFSRQPAKLDGLLLESP